MARTLIRGPQVKDESITDRDLAKDSVITEKIKDGNVTCQKLAVGICDRLLSSDSPIGRVKLTQSHLARTDFVLPNGMMYEITSFVSRVAIYRNGQLLYNGLLAPVDIYDPVDVFPGSDNSKVQFDFDLKKGETIQVVLL